MVFLPRSDQPVSCPVAATSNPVCASELAASMYVIVTQPPARRPPAPYARALAVTRTPTGYRRQPEPGHGSDRREWTAVQKWSSIRLDSTLSVSTLLALNTRTPA